MTIAIECTAQVYVFKKQKSKTPRAICEQTGVMILYKNNFYPAMILTGSDHIMPGQSGIAKFGILFQESSIADEFVQGTEFELKNGPVLDFGNAKVLSFKRV